MTIQEFNRTKIWVKRPQFSDEWRENLSKSHTWHKHSEETLQKMRKRIPWNKWKKTSNETRGKISNAQKWVKKSLESRIKRSASLPSWEKHWNWKWWINPLNNSIRKSFEYKLWAQSVFARDNWACQKCNVKWWSLTAHHIENFSDKIDLRFVESNGITFCEEHHMEFHNIYWRQNNNLEQILKFIWTTT